MPPILAKADEAAARPAKANAETIIDKWTDLLLPIMAFSHRGSRATSRIIAASQVGLNSLPAKIDGRDQAVMKYIG
jgi:hypothetical protein